MGAESTGDQPDLVDDHEDVCRLCYDADLNISRDGWPDEMDPQTKRIRVAQISKEDLLDKGFSLQRLELFTCDMALATCEHREQKRAQNGKARAGFRLKGGFVSPVERIHRIVDEGGTGERVFRVYATPNAESEAHAEIKLDPRQKIAFQKWRLRLWEELGELRSVEEVAWRKG